MRPKKRILLYCADADRAGALAFILRQTGRSLGYEPMFAVTVCTTGLMLAAEVREYEWDAALLIDAKAQHVEAVKSHRPLCPILGFGGDGERVLSATAPMETLIEALKLLVARKRGPRRGTPWSDERKALAQLAREKAKVPASAPALAGTLLRGQHA